MEFHLLAGKCAFSTYYDERNSLHSWKCFANTLDIISQMKENSQSYYHQLWRKQSNFQDMYHKRTTMAVVSKKTVGKLLGISEMVPRHFPSRTQSTKRIQVGSKDECNLLGSHSAAWHEKQARPMLYRQPAFGF